LFVGRLKHFFGSNEQELIDGLKYIPTPLAPTFRRAWLGATKWAACPVTGASLFIFVDQAPPQQSAKVSEPNIFLPQ
jgi:hypothetical protein